MTSAVPVHVEPGDPLVLEIHHRGAVVMRVPVRVAGPGPVSVHRVQAHVADLEYQLALVQRRLTEELARSEERRRRLGGTILGRGGW